VLYRIVCKTGEYVTSDRLNSGPVRVTVKSEFLTESAEHFTYVVRHITYKFDKGTQLLVYKLITSKLDCSYK